MRRAHLLLDVVATIAAGVVVGAAMLLPDRLTRTDLGSFLAIPLELALGAALLLVLPPAARRPVAIALSVLLGALTVLKIIDIGFYAALSRPFDPVLDWGLASGTWQLLDGSLGAGRALLIVAGALLAVAALALLIIWSVLRLTRLLDGHPSAGLPVRSRADGDLAGLRDERGRPGVAVPDRLPRQHVQDHRRDRRGARRPAGRAALRRAGGP